MHIAINFVGIEYHISILEDEKKKVKNLKEDLNKCYQLEQGNGCSDLSAVKNMLDALNRLDDSISKRIKFLESLVEDFTKLSEKGRDRLERMDYHNPDQLI